ncbi:MAG: SpaA isopeptide-forming pilin-related protein [bacterium]|nr:SpaA isopeptide-forming pilin-related protein [bacterium]
MKQNLIKIGKYFSILAIVIVALFIGKTSVYAATIAKKEIPGYEGKEVYKNTNFVGGATTTALGANPFITVDGKIAYCVEFGQLLDIAYGGSASGFSANDISSYTTGSGYSRFNVNLTSSIINKISLIAYYGYGYDGHNTGKYYLATQAMILETIYANANDGGNKAIISGSNFDYIDNIYWTVDGSKIDISAERKAINSLVNNHAKTPNFGRTNVEMRVSDTTTLTDSNKVLGNFTVTTDNNNVGVTVSNNNLNLKANSVGTTNITISKSGSNGQNLVYTKDGNVQGNQKIATFGKVTANETKIKVTVTAPEEAGNFKLIKTDLSGNNKLNGAVFKFGTNLDGTENIDWYYATTDENGEINISGINPGTYYYQEVTAPTGYIIVDSDVKKVTIENNKTAEVIVTNKQITGKLEFSKVDFSTEAPLPDTLIQIYTVDGKLVFEGRTDQDGKIVIDELAYGEYYILEKDAPAGYELNEEKMPFSITEDGKIVKATMKNYKISNPKTADMKVMAFSLIGLTSLGLSVYWYKKQKLVKVLNK